MAIYILVTAKHRYTVEWLLEARRGRMPLEMRSVSYEELGRGSFIEPASFVFTDLERLTPGQLESAARIWTRLARSSRRIQLLNHPLLVMRRFELLRTLHEKGLNDFDVYRLTEARRPRRYPVFIRGENDHRGSETALLRTREELNEAIGTLVEAGKCRDTRIVTEFCNVPDEEGYFRKYSAFRVGDAVFARHILFDRSWVVKVDQDSSTPRMLAEEHDYLRANPHATELRRIFDLARIDYGRIDYGVVEGRIQVYEINTSPVMYYETTEARQVAHFPDLPSPTDRLLAAFALLDAQSARPPPADATPAGEPASP